MHVLIYWDSLLQDEALQEVLRVTFFIRLDFPLIFIFHTDRSLKLPALRSFGEYTWSQGAFHSLWRIYKKYIVYETQSLLYVKLMYLAVNYLMNFQFNLTSLRESKY